MGKLTDMQRILQLFTNSAFVEAKTQHQVMQTKLAEDALKAAKRQAAGTSSLNGILIDDDKDLNLPLADSHMEVGIHLDGAA